VIKNAAYSRIIENGLSAPQINPIHGQDDTHFGRSPGSRVIAGIPPSQFPSGKKMNTDSSFTVAGQPGL